MLRLAHALGQGHERDDAAFAIMVRPHDEDDVFDGDDEHQRPEGQAGEPHDFQGWAGAFGELTMLTEDCRA